MHSSDIRIRDARIEDADAIARLIRHLADATGEGEKVRSRTEHFRKHGFGPQPQFFSLIAEQSGTVVGLSLWLYNFSSWRGDLGAYLQDLYVDDTVRGSGLGKRLLAETSRRAVKHGASHLRLSVATKNTAARAFYAHLGFTYRDDERIYQISDAALTDLAAESQEAGE